MSDCRNMLLGHVVLAATSARSGRTDEARAAAAEVMRTNPNYTVSGAQKWLSPFPNAEHA
jgi:adenylate cyclase